MAISRPLFLGNLLKFGIEKGHTGDDVSDLILIDDLIWPEKTLSEVGKMSIESPYFVGSNMGGLVPNTEDQSLIRFACEDYFVTKNCKVTSTFKVENSEKFELVYARSTNFLEEI